MKPPLNAAGQLVPERIALFGPEKAGKTHSWMSIAALHAKRKSPATFYVIDTDFAVPRMMMSDEFSGLTNIVYEECGSWQDIRDATKMFLGKMQPHDWLVVDLITQAWDWVQTHYIEKVYGMDAEDFFLMKQKEARSEGKATINFGEVIEWPVVNKLYNPWATSLISHRGHVLVVAAEKEINKREQDKSELKDFRAAGVKMAAQKHTGYLMHTIIRVRSQKQGEPRLNTIGDRGREPFKGEIVKNFPMQYLVARAGWTL